MVKIFDRTNVDFIVKEDEGVVIARFKDPRQICERWVDKLEANSLNYIVSSQEYLKMYERIAKVRGIAKCAEGDTFDLKIGKRIALSKLKIKAMTSITKTYITFQEKLIDEVEKIDKYIVDGFDFLNNESGRLNVTIETVESHN